MGKFILAAVLLMAFNPVSRAETLTIQESWAKTDPMTCDLQISKKKKGKKDEGDDSDPEDDCDD
ncbi:MAG: hypothetical protein IME93_00015 [Proteobacteria bacterium]|nr:hypothetical protein [Pseudomonadota bacterium]